MVRFLSATSLLGETNLAGVPKSLILGALPCTTSSLLALMLTSSNPARRTVLFPVTTFSALIFKSPEPNTGVTNIGGDPLVSAAAGTKVALSLLAKVIFRVVMVVVLPAFW